VVAFSTLFFKACQSHVHGDHNDHDVHHHHHGRLLKRTGPKPVKGNVTKPTNPQVLNRCGYKSPSKEKLAEINEALSSLGEINTNDIITVPVYWWAINDGVNGNTKSDVTRSIQVLNQRYAPVGFYFDLVELYFFNNAALFNNPGYDDANAITMKTQLRYGDRSALNIWSVKIANGILGYATFPDKYQSSPTLDGVVIDYRTVPGGSYAPYNMGITLVHEVGHWLGLLHTFHPNTFTVTGTCATDLYNGGDSVADTPAQNGPSSGCPIGRDSCQLLKGVDVSNFSHFFHYIYISLLQLIRSFFLFMLLYVLLK
jgi:hypothetical protein